MGRKLTKNLDENILFAKYTLPKQLMTFLEITEVVAVCRYFHVTSKNCFQVDEESVMKHTLKLGTIFWDSNWLKAKVYRYESKFRFFEWKNFSKNTVAAKKYNMTPRYHRGTFGAPILVKLLLWVNYPSIRILHQTYSFAQFFRKILFYWKNLHLYRKRSFWELLPFQSRATSLTIGTVIFRSEKVKVCVLLVC